MAAVGTLTISANVSNLPNGQETFLQTLTTAAAVGEVLPVALISGNTTVAVPAGTRYAIIAGPNVANPVPNPSYGGTILVKGASGDTGIPVSAAGVVVLSWDATGGVNAAPANLIFTASAIGTATVLFI